MANELDKDEMIVSVHPDMQGGIGAALEKVRGQKARIVLEAGCYFIENTLVLGEEHNGLRVEGKPGARLIGGKALRQFGHITDESVRRRLGAAAKSVLVCDLAREGIDDCGTFKRRGYAGDIVPAQAELFCSQKPMRLARYPKDGFLSISGYEEEIINECEEAIGHPDAGFFFEDERVRAWQDADDIWAHGYWCWDWANSYEKVTAFDKQRMCLSLDIPKGKVRGFKPGQRFYLLNVLEEVTTPGDYYIDRERKLLYFYPPEAFDPGDVVLSMLEGPMFHLQGCQDVSICGLGLESTRGHAIVATDAVNTRIDGSHFQNIGNCALHMTGGRGNAFVNCTVHDTGESGVFVIAGDRMTLEGADIRIENNHFYRIATWSRCYRPPVHVSGVGIAIRHNLMHDCPHCAVLWSGNDIAIEQNEIYNVVMETGDAGAIYGGRDVTFRGNTVSGNYIHHLGGVGLGTMGIYNDDVLSGTVMENNYFYEVGRAVMLGGGKDYVVKNNVFVKCYPAIQADARGAHVEFFWTPVYEQMREALYNAKQSFFGPNDESIRLDATKPPYSTRYPELMKMDAMYQSGEPFKPSGHIEGNVFCAKPLFRYRMDRRDDNNVILYDEGKPVKLSQEEMCLIFDTRHDILGNWGFEKGEWLLKGNCNAAPDDFEDAAWGDFTLKAGAAAHRYSYKQQYAFEDIGLVRAQRRENPADVRTCLSYAYHDPQRVLTLGMQNRLDTPVAFDMTLHTADGSLDITRQPIAFILGPKETKHVRVGTLEGKEKFKVEARSACPGVRPCRAEDYMGTWNRF